MKWIWPVFVLMIACSHKTPQQKFREFVDDPKNKINQKIIVGDITATLKWIPEEYRRTMNPSSHENNQYDYFEAKFDKVKDDNPTKEKIMYLDFDMQKDFQMVIDNDSILPAICQRIQNGQKNSYDYMLAFEKIKNQKKDFTVEYKDKMFGIGTLLFVYKQDDFKKIPILAVK